MMAVCPKCKGRATKLYSVSHGRYTCQQCEHQWDPHAVALGRKGGKATSEAKAEAARANGKKGGRPKGAGLTAKDVTVTHEPPDGWWIDLPFGWVMDDGSHGIAEDTKREALAKLALASPCECDGCTAREK